MKLQVRVRGAGLASLFPLSQGSRNDLDARAAQIEDQNTGVLRQFSFLLEKEEQLVWRELRRWVPLKLEEAQYVNR